MNASATKKIVRGIRKQFEEGSVDQELLAQLYRGYTDVGDTREFVAKAKDLFPEGNCGLASLYLKRELGGEVVQGTYKGQGHTFLLVNNTVIDITGDQFGGPKVYIGPLKSPWSLERK